MGIVLPGGDCVAYGYCKCYRRKATMQGDSFLHNYVRYPINAIRSMFFGLLLVSYMTLARRGGLELFVRRKAESIKDTHATHCFHTSEQRC